MVSVYFPEGTWYHYFNRKNYQGGKSYEIAAPLETINVFVRENSIIPTASTIGFDAESTMANGVELIKYGKNAIGQLYLDDFNSYEHQSGKFGWYKINSDLSLELVDGEGGFDQSLVAS